MSRERVIEIARLELGVTEQPPGSNRVKYWDAYDPAFQGQPWCVAFLWWCFDKAGERMAFFGGGKTASCSTLLRWYREQGLTVPVSEVQPGDIVLLNFNGKGTADHCGIVVVGQYFLNLSGINPKNQTYVMTIEGNTTPGEEGIPQEQANGGCVAFKRRYLNQIVAVCRPQYKVEEPETGDPSSAPSGHLPPGEGKDDITGHWAEDNIRWCIEHGLMQGYPDGSFQPDKPVTRAELATVIRRLVEQ